MPPAMKLGQGNIFTGVCDSVHRAVSLSACWDTTPHPRDHSPPLTRHPPGPDTPPPPRAEHTGRYGQQAGGMHPTGMQSCFYTRMHSSRMRTAHCNCRFSCHACTPPLCIPPPHTPLSLPCTPPPRGQNS